MALAGALLALPLTSRAAVADPPCVMGVVCTASPSPSPSPSASPSPRPSASPGRAASPRPTASTPAPAPKPAAAVAATPLPSPSPDPAARFHNAPFLADLLTVLHHPVSATTPDLKHFRLDAAAAARAHAAAVAAAAATEGASGRTRLGAGPLLAAWLVGPAAALAAGRWGRRLPRAIRRGGLWVILAGLAAGASGLHVVTPPAVATAVVARPSTLPSAAPAPSPSAAPRLGPDWEALVSVETEIAHSQDALAQQEAVIRDAAASPDAAPTPIDLPSVSNNADRGVRVDPEAQAQRKVGRLLEAYRAAATRYQQTLQREYDLYRVAAQDPARKQQLVAAAATNPRPEVRDAVAYNLGLVQAQLEQEAVINAAEAKLAAIGSLSGSQLTAMRHHQAFIIPVEAPIIQGFGPTDVGFEPTVTYHGTFYPHFHTGIDIVGLENVPVHAAADGVVLLAHSSRDAQGRYTGYGNYVVVAHPDGFVTLYGHLNAFSVKEGDVVHQGQILGQEGSTGLSTGPHVHFEIRHNGDWVDPEPYLTGKQST